MSRLLVLSMIILLCASAADAVSPGLAKEGRLGRKLPVFPKCPPPAKTLQHVNLLDAPDDIRLALTVLQGLVNREQPRIYITQNPGWHTPAAIPKWMDGLREKGYSFEEVSDPLTLVSKFRSSVKGAVLYESNLAANPESLHKLNALTLYCAINNTIPVTAELHEKLKLPVALDARGKWNNPGEAYEWAYRELWPRANHSVFAFTCPSHIVLRDYLVAHKIMPFWMSTGMTRSDGEWLLKFLEDLEPNSPVMGCWGGYGEQPPGTATEPDLQRLVSERGKFIVVTDGCFNLSVHSGLEEPRRHGDHGGENSDPGLLRDLRASVVDISKVYLCFNVTDGDNLQYIQQYFRSGQWWENADRGKVPISWSLNPLAAEIMPDVVEYLYRTRTPNDEFVCSTAGIGLQTPSLYGKDLYANHQAVYDEYLKLTGEAMDRLGMQIVHLGDTSGVPWTRADFDEWARKLPNLDGIIGDYGPALGVSSSRATFTVARGVSVLRALAAPGNSAPNDQSAKLLADAIRDVVPKERPAFVHICLINWFNSPTVVVDALKLLGPEYVPVLPSEMMRMLRQP